MVERHDADALIQPPEIRHVFREERHLIRGPLSPQHRQYGKVSLLIVCQLVTEHKKDYIYHACNLLLFRKSKTTARTATLGHLYLRSIIFDTTTNWYQPAAIALMSPRLPMRKPPRSR